jgi:MoaA/NifB/PqqE/SkfB family radical SAM enzyme
MSTSEQKNVETTSRPLFVNVEDQCQAKCWYCGPWGENRHKGLEELAAEKRLSRLTVERLLEILAIAYERGTRTFRFTGGEPTLNPRLGEILVATQALGNDVQIAMTTNGFRLAEIVGDLGQLRDPLVFLSVDGLAQVPAARGGLRVPKLLDGDLDQTIQRVREVAKLRFNYVLSRSTVDHVELTIDAAFERGLDIKIFELLHRYYNPGRYDGQGDWAPSDRTFLDQYVSIRDDGVFGDSEVPETLLEYLHRRFGEPEPFAGTGGRGIPMKAFRGKAGRVIVFDSLAGSHYGDICRSCARFPCQEGLYALVLDVSGVLHPAGCENVKHHVNIAGRDRSDVWTAFGSLESVIDLADLDTQIPKALRGRYGSRSEAAPDLLDVLTVSSARRRRRARPASGLETRLSETPTVDQR